MHMSFATARVAPEKQFHRLPAAGTFCDVMETMDMNRSSCLSDKGVFDGKG